MTPMWCHFNGDVWLCNIRCVYVELLRSWFVASWFEVIRGFNWLPGLYGLKFGNLIVCRSFLHLNSYNLVGSMTQSSAGFLAELLRFLWWLGRERGGRIRGAQGARRRRGSRGKGIFHGGSAFYPCSVVPAVDEDVRARHSSKQLRGQARGGAGRSGFAPAVEHPPCSTL